MKQLIIITIVLFTIACNKEVVLDESTLEEYIELNTLLELGDNVVACAGGRELGLLGSQAEPTDIIFYPIPEATEFRYFEADNIADSLDFSKYLERPLGSEPIFNGYLWKFNNRPFD